jgi:hypothetical protein
MRKVSLALTVFNRMDTVTAGTPWGDRSPMYPKEPVIAPLTGSLIPCGIPLPGVLLRALPDCPCKGFLLNCAVTKDITVGLNQLEQVQTGVV